MKKFYYSIWFYIIVGFIASVLLAMAEITFRNGWSWYLIFIPFLVFVMGREEIAKALDKYLIAQKEQKVELMLKEQQKKKEDAEKLLTELSASAKDVREELEVLGFIFHKENVQMNPSTPNQRWFYATDSNKVLYKICFNNKSGYTINTIS
jgi:hypothetical protein